VVFRIIGDGTAAAQALRNQEVDIYQGQPTADSVNLLSAIPTAKIIGGDQAVYEHIDLRVGTASGVDEPYTGPFAGMSQKAVDLRTAFLMAYPRDEIVDKLIKPINSKAVRMDSLLIFPSEPGYADMIKQSGVAKYTKGSQSDREKEALALVRKHSATDVKVNLLWGTPSNARRAASAQIVKAALGRAGFDVNAPGVVAWSSQLDSSAWDAEFFAWVKSSVTQKGNADLFCSDCGNMLLGYSNKAVDAAGKRLGATLLSEKQKFDQYLIIEKELMKDAVSLPIFQHPGVTAVNKKLQNVKPNPLSPQLVWNYWEWKYSK
jgi:peptide/nickel transport system substrate-binding protein